MKITDKKFVAAAYELYVGGENGTAPELMEKATAQQPLTFLFGMGMMLESFEAKLKDLQTGDKFDFVLPCAEAYGEYYDERVTDLPKSIFEIDGKFDDEFIQVDRIIPMTNSDGMRLDGTVLEIGQDSVKMDFNHPLAGEDLHFIGEILEVREATDEEMESLMGACCSCQDCQGGQCEDGRCGCGSCH